MSRYVNRGRRQFSQSEKIAYHGGRAWARGKAGKQVTCKGEKNKQSFRNGVQAERARIRNGGN